MPAPKSFVLTTEEKNTFEEEFVLSLDDYFTHEDLPTLCDPDEKKHLSTIISFLREKKGEDDPTTKAFIAVAFNPSRRHDNTVEVARAIKRACVIALGETLFAPGKAGAEALLAYLPEYFKLHPDVTQAEDAKLWSTALAKQRFIPFVHASPPRLTIYFNIIAALSTGQADAFLDARQLAPSTALFTKRDAKACTGDHAHLDDRSMKECTGDTAQSKTGKLTVISDSEDSGREEAVAKALRKALPPVYRGTEADSLKCRDFLVAFFNYLTACNLTKKDSYGNRSVPDRYYDDVIALLLTKVDGKALMWVNDNKASHHTYSDFSKAFEDHFGLNAATKAELRRYLRTMKQQPKQSVNDYINTAHSTYLRSADDEDPINLVQFIDLCIEGFHSDHVRDRLRQYRTDRKASCRRITLEEFKNYAALVDRERPSSSAPSVRVAALFGESGDVPMTDAAPSQAKTKATDPLLKSLKALQKSIAALQMNASAGDPQKAHPNDSRGTTGSNKGRVDDRANDRNDGNRSFQRHRSRFNDRRHDRSRSPAEDRKVLSRREPHDDRKDQRPERGSKIKCWECSKPGHCWYDCPDLDEPTIRDYIANKKYGFAPPSIAAKYGKHSSGSSSSGRSEN